MVLAIDGAQGEGGGQIVRTSLALSALTGTPITLNNIRAGRKRPGLMRQHVTCVQAAAQICDAVVDGAELGAKAFTFEPNRVACGNYKFSVGSAGSTSLVAQTVLPALMLAEDSSVVELEGGTHNPGAPPFEFLVHAFGRQLATLGPQLTGTLVRHGFYPAGGGSVRYEISPTEKLRGMELTERVGKLTPQVCAVVSGIPRHVGERECDTIRRKANWGPDCFYVDEIAHPQGPGNVVLIRLDFDNVTEVFTGFGKPGVRAEQVARGVLREARSYLSTEVPVGEYLADQILLPLGVAASQGHPSRFRTMRLSTHSETHIRVLQQFLEIDVKVESCGDRQVVVELVG